MKILILLVCFSILIQQFKTQEFKFINNSPFQNTLQRKFLYSVNLLDCDERATVLFYYKATVDKGNHSRSDTFNFDPLVKRECQQIATKAYGNSFDRGHQVPANHLDFDLKAIQESNFMTNILPQHSVLNKGAWQLSEEITECYRDLSGLEIIGGLIMGDDSVNDLFIKSHGVRTPDFFWKIIRVTDTGDIISWIIPNDETAVTENIDKFLTSVHDIEQKSGFEFPSIDNRNRHKIQPHSWTLPKECNLSRKDFK